MKLTQESAYGIEGLMVLAHQTGGAVMQLSEIAAEGSLPQSFLAKIFQKLAHHGVVRSFRGAKRGYTLMQPAATITLKHILTAIEGPELFTRCIFWSDRCSTVDPCPLHDEWKKMSQQIERELLDKTTLADLVKKSTKRAKKARQLVAESRT